MSSVLPITSFDSQKLLEINSFEERYALLKKMLVTLEETANSRLFQ